MDVKNSNNPAAKMSVDVKLSRMSVTAFGVVKTKHPLSPG